jgi:excinuclease UvrABC ATPase subunit
MGAMAKAHSIQPSEGEFELREAQSAVPSLPPATYTQVFDPIRDLFAQLPEARAWGYGKGRFSFNVKGGRCEACRGDGYIKVKMHFLADVFVPCETCKGRRFNQATPEVRYKGHCIANVLELSIDQAATLFSAHPAHPQHLAGRGAGLFQAGPGAFAQGHRPHPLYLGRAHRRPAL